MDLNFSFEDLNWKITNVVLFFKQDRQNVVYTLSNLSKLLFVMYMIVRSAKTKSDMRN